MTIYVSDQLQATAAAVSGVPTPDTSWQWLRNGAPISGATSSVYYATADDLGTSISVVQSAINMLGTATATSAADGPVLPFLPSLLFRNAATQGVWYDPSDTTTLFRGATGTTPVTAVEQPVGLILDKSKGLVLGSELVDTANTAAAWTPSSLNIVTQDGDAVKIETVDNPVGATLLLNQIGGLSVDMVSNRWYVLTAEVKINTGSAQVLLIYGGNGTSSVTLTSTAYIPIKFYVLKTTSNDITLRFNQLSSPETVWIRNISVRELPGNHAFNSSGNSANFPVLSARYNLLTKTEDFSDAVWSKVATTVTANAGTDPLGGNTADSLQATSANSLVYQAVSGLSNNTTYKLSVYVKTASAGATAILAFYTNSGGTTVGSQSFTTTGAWQLVELTVNSGTLTGATWFGIGGANSFSTGEDILVWGADLRVSNDALNQPAYQRVNTATDYDTVGFKPYLRFNGTNQWLQTNSIDFTYGDKMFVSAGVRKLSDSAAGMLLELSTNQNSANNAFYISAPESGNSYGVRVGGNIGYNHSTFAAPISNVFSGAWDNRGATVTVGVVDRFNGVLNTVGQLGTTMTQVNFGNYPLYIGARAGTSLWFNGRLYSLIVAGKLANAVEITETEKYVNGKTAAY